MILENNLISPQVMSSTATPEFTGAKVGDTISIRRPAFFVASEYNNNGTAQVVMQDAKENSVQLQIEKYFDVSFEVTSKELTFEVDQFNARLLTPAMAAITQAIDKYAFSKLSQLGGLPQHGVSTGSNLMDKYASPSSVNTFALIQEMLNLQQVPVGGRQMVLSPAMQTAMYGIDNFISAQIRGIGNSPINDYQLGNFMGFDMSMSQNLSSHSVGAAQGDANAGALTAGSDLKEGQTKFTPSNPAGTGAFAQGDTIAITYDDGKVRHHSVVSGSLGGEIEITPGIYGIDTATPSSGSAGTKCVDSANAVKIIAGDAQNDAYAVGGAFHQDAFQIVFVPQPEPMGPGTSSATVSYNGMSLRVLQSYDHLRKKDMVSIDCLVGCKAVDPRLGVKVVSA